MKVETIHLLIKPSDGNCRSVPNVNTLIRLRFNPIYFMQNYTYFKQFYQECLNQNIQFLYNDKAKKCVYKLYYCSVYSDAVKHAYDKHSRYGSYTYTHAYWILAN